MEGQLYGQDHTLSQADALTKIKFPFYVKTNSLNEDDYKMKKHATLKIWD